MSPHRARLSVAALAWALLAAGLGARQKPAPPQTFRANVDLVQVDVVVFDRDGKPIHGLTKADFTLLDRKELQTISAFQEISRSYEASAETELPADIPRDVADNSTARSDRLVVLAIDDMVPADRFDRIKELARQVVQELGRNASMALLTSSNARKVEVTDNRALILAQIDQVSLRSAYAPRVARQTRVETGTCAPHLFEQASQVLGPEDARRKAFVYISPYCSADLKELIRMMTAHPQDTSGLDDPIIRMIEALRRANVAFYAIDPRGAADFSLGHFDSPNLVGTSGRPGVPAAPPVSVGFTGAQASVDQATADWRRSCLTRSCDPVLISQDNMRLVSEATGGFAITNTDDFHAGMARLVDDFDHYYLLGFSPADRKGKGFRPIEVTVNRPGATLRYRRGYAVEGVPELPKNTDPMVQLSAGVLPRSGLPLRLLATPLPSAAKTTRVAVGLEIRSAPGLTNVLRDDLDITILAVDLNRNKVSQEFKRPRQLLLPPPAAGASGGIAYRIVTAIDLAPGTYQLRTSAKSGRQGIEGSVYTTVEVPNYQKTRLALGGLTLGYADPKRRAAETTAMDAATLPFEPAFERIFSASDELRLYCDIWRQSAAVPLTTTVALLGEHGQTITTMDGREPAGREGDKPPHVDVSFSLAQVAPAPYRLRVTVNDGVTSATREIGIVVK